MRIASRGVKNIDFESIHRSNSRRYDASIRPHKYRFVLKKKKNKKKIKIKIKINLKKSLVYFYPFAPGRNSDSRAAGGAKLILPSYLASFTLFPLAHTFVTVYFVCCCFSNKLYNDITAYIDLFQI